MTTIQKTKVLKRTSRSRLDKLFPNRTKYAEGISASVENRRKTSPFRVKYRPKVGNGFSKYFLTPQEADDYAMDLTAQILRDGQNFQLSTSEKAAMVLWRNHRENRLATGKSSMTLDEAIQFAIQAEKDNDETVQYPPISETFTQFFAYKEKEAAGKNTESARLNAKRFLADVSKCLSYFPEESLMDIFEKEETVQGLEDELYDTIAGKTGGYPTKTTINHYRRALNVFLNWACKRKIIVQNPINLLPPITDEEPPRETYSPEELKNLLALVYASHPDYIPWLTLGTFCGVRSREIARMEWKDIHMEDKELMVPHMKTKTGEPRLVPLPDAAVAWLKYWFSLGNTAEGPIIPAANTNRRIWTMSRWMETLKKEGFNWKRNALRHSFASYACAREMVYEQVASWLGNSPAVMAKHYRKAKGKKEANEWFSITPAVIEAMSSPTVE